MNTKSKDLEIQIMSMSHKIDDMVKDTTFIRQTKAELRNLQVIFESLQEAVEANEKLIEKVISMLHIPSQMTLGDFAEVEKFSPRYLRNNIVKTSDHEGWLIVPGYKIRLFKKMTRQTKHGKKIVFSRHWFMNVQEYQNCLNKMNIDNVYYRGKRIGSDHSDLIEVLKKKKYN